MIKTLKTVTDDRVRGYIVWLPIYGGDFKGEAQKLANSFPDRRVSYFLDPDSETGKQWQPVLETPFIAWDVYLLYGPDAHWETEPPEPAFWMHQLGLVKGAPRLDEETFTGKLKEMVGEVRTPLTMNEATANAKIEFLYFKSCPGHRQALINLNAALREIGIRADLRLINVTTEAQAERVGFQGSPSIRVNGRDLDGRDEGYAYSCRVYQIDGKVTPVPTKDFIERKLRDLIR
jgi:hypothetical protein